MTLYEESLIRGQLVGRGWNGAGYVNAWEDMRLDPTKHPTPQSFWLEIDGQLLASHWEWQEWDRDTARSSDERRVQTHTVLTLEAQRAAGHSQGAYAARRHAGDDALAGDHQHRRPAGGAGGGLTPGAACCRRRRAGARTCADESETRRVYTPSAISPTRTGATRAISSGTPCPSAAYRIDGRYRRDRHRHPLFVLRNNATGEHFDRPARLVGRLLASSSTWTPTSALADGAARLFFRAGPDAPAPQRIIAPGETVRTPEMHLGLVFGDLDAAIQAMHDHLRRSVFMPQPRGRGGWIEIGHRPGARDHRRSR